MRGSARTTKWFADHRRGAVAVLVALLSIPLLIFVALCVDLGWIALTKSELQNAADSAATAGARQLVDNYAEYSLAGEPQRSLLLSAAHQTARTFSTQFAGYNGAGDVASLSVSSGDIQFGFTDTSGNFSTSNSNFGYPNTVQVTTRRDTGANGKLPLFFAPVLGRRDAELTATASATIYSGLITSFRPALITTNNGSCSGNDGDVDDFVAGGGTANCLLLPVAFDVNNWNHFFSQGESPDGIVHTDSAGTPQIQVYPSPQNSPGNFGLLCTGHWTNNNPDFRFWINNGPTAADVQYLIDQQMLPVTQSTPRPWKGSPGLKSQLVQEFVKIIGKPRVLPLFKPASLTPYQAASGNGSNTTYNIVGFVGVKVTQATGNGSNMNISVQPCSVFDTTAVFDSSTLFPAGFEPSSQLRSFTQIAPKLTH